MAELAKAVSPPRRPHPHKLTQGAEFRAALAGPHRHAGKGFVLRAVSSPNVQRADRTEPPLATLARLGLVAGRKAARRAVDRNRAKRLAREVFRAARSELPRLDIVLQLKNDLRRSSNAEVRRELDRLLRFLMGRNSQTQA